MLMLLKKRSTIISLILAVIFATACYYYFAIYNSVRDLYVSSDYIGYPTGKALISNAELVVVGSPLKDFEDRELHLSRFSNGALEDIATFTEREQLGQCLSLIDIIETPPERMRVIMCALSYAQAVFFCHI